MASGEPYPDTALSAEKLELLDYLFEEEGIDSARLATIPRRDDRGPAPLSFGQLRLWFLDRWQPGSPVYHIVSALRLVGELDGEALERSLGEIARRHEVLRTVFREMGDEPAQVVTAAEEPVRLPVVDLGTLPAAARQAEADRVAGREVYRPFDLTRGPLWRATLLRSSPREHTLLLALHHIISDGWSTGVMAREIQDLYRAFSEGRPAALPELPLQYSDFAAWQRRALERGSLREGLDHWRGQLAGAPALLELPADHPRPAVQGFAGGRFPVEVTAATAAALEALAPRERTTLFGVLLAAFATLLHRYTGAPDLPDLVVGSPVANRNREETEGLIGLFVNMLALRVRPSGEQTFRELLRPVQETLLGAYEHQDVPFEALLDELRPERAPSHSPLFQVVLVLQNAPLPPLELPSLELVSSEVPTGTAKFDLMLSLVETGRGLAGAVEYRRELFEPATIERLAGHLCALLDGAAEAPDRRLGDLPLLTAAERYELLHEWSGPAAAEAPGVCLHRLFEARAESAQDTVGVVAGGLALTYAELNRRADRLARHLRRLGVCPESLVGLCSDASPDMVVGILGILKAGGAYVPLDPEWPRERLALVLESVTTPVVVTSAGVAADLPDGVERLSLDFAFPFLDSAAPPGPDLPASAAYVIHTSGSTGRPKGVVVPHRNVARLFTATAASVGFGEADVWTLFHSYTFDFSVWELWGALLHGGRVVLVPRAAVRSPEALLALLRDEQVTVLSQTPSAFQQLVRADTDADAGAEPLALRWVIFGGEALDLQSLLAPWFERRGDRSPRLANLYGITETTVHATWRPLGAADLAPGLGSRIGRPLADLGIYLTDARLELVPAGVPGEVCVAGPGLARGYLGDPALTALRFRPDPFGGVPGGRLYRSGDLARRRPGEAGGGDLEYLGRIDHQVKVRGYRIEPGEIEAALGRHPAVTAAVVVVREESPDARRLIAYFVPRADPPDVDELRLFLGSHLPDYMVPSAFVCLDRLPLTANGKLDRAALPAPGADRPDLRAAYAPPRTDTEEVLVQIWAQVLGLDQVGVTDNFFALGGDSILTLRVHALAQERGLRFELPQLFARQTVAELAREIDSGAAGPLGAVRAGPLSLISPEDRGRLPAGIEDAYPLTAVQSGMLYHMRYAPDEIVYHNVYSYPLRGRCEPEAFQRAAQRVIDRHPILRTGFDLTSYAEPLQLVHETAALEVGADDLSALPAEEQERVLDTFVEREKRHGFDVSRPPLVRLHLHRRGAESFNLTLTECHPIFDGWSLHSFLAEIFDGYLALLGRGALPAAPPLQLSVRDFVALERAAAESPEARLYWSETLAHSKPLALPRWPRCDSAGHAPQGRIRIVLASLPKAVQQGLKRLARSAAVPLKSVLLAAHLKVMGRLAGGDDVLTGLVSNGRPEGTDGDRILGLFFNAVPFRMRVPEGSWSDLVRATFETERRMLPFRRYPLARLQQTHGGKRLYEVLFNYIHFHVLRDLFEAGEVELRGDIRRWEETDMPLSTTFMQDPATGVLQLMLRYDSEQLAPWQAGVLRGLYERTLRAMAGSPEERHDLELLLSAPERHQILVEWAGPGQAARRPACIHELFEEQVGRTPDAIAAVMEEEALSYAALDARADRLAWWLWRAGVGPEARVGILMHRSLEMLVAMLGILKAGGAYVPLDPLYPRERLAFVLGEAGISLLLTQERLARELPALEGLRVLPLDSGWTEPAEGTPERLRSGVTDDCAAYVLFTSGSTGTPKGVVVEHRQLASYVAGVVERLAPPAGARFAMASTFAADLGNTAVFPSLCGGGCLHVLSEERAADPAAWEEYGSRCPLDVLKIVPSHLAALLSSPNAAAILPRERLVFGGEALDWAVIEKVRALAPGLAVFNHYGPTETTVGVTTCRVDGPALPAGAATVPLGRPIAGVRIHLVDANLVPVPLGIAGELCVGGASVARGYLARPPATAERFLPDPFAPEPGARLYRTGDQARWLPDGRIEFLGRRDGQVKIRGFRIELHEIELALGQHPGIRDVAVAVRQDRAGERRLVAYVVAEGEVPPDSELRSLLRRRLPDYMLPAGFVWLEELPRTANGKLDRGALPMTGELASWRPEHVAPRNELERAIAAVWQEVLGVDRVGIDDNFFDLGGHSLIMLRVHSKLRGLVAADLPMVVLFEYPTIAELARYLSTAREQKPDASRAPIPGERADARHAALERRRRPKAPAAPGEE